MNALFIPVRLENLDWQERSFEIRSCTPDSRLADSLDRFGILVPPWVLDNGAGGYIPVDGFKRLSHAREKGVASVECRVFDSTAARGDLLLTRIETKLFEGPLNPAEKARIVSLLWETVSFEHLCEKYLPVLQIPARREVVDRWLCLAARGDAFLEAAVSGKICDRAALLLAEWEDAAGEKGLGILKDLRCSASIQVEILEGIIQIALRDDASVGDVLGRRDFNAVLDDPHLNHRQKTQTLRSLLTRLRFPRLRAREERFANEVRRVRLPGGVQIVPPPSFEGDHWQLNLHFCGIPELQSLLDETRRIAGSPAMAKLMSSTQQESMDETGTPGNSLTFRK
ncbi:MAG: hypothetical protein HPY84_01115 [Syntrophobacteraceae bacterium]|nr:hypothetical protein [Syntrophobacteraceae bacterium]